MIEHPRAHLDQIELLPFQAAIDGGAGAVMAAHIVLPALDPARYQAAREAAVPATFSRPILTICCATRWSSTASSTPIRCRWSRFRRTLPPDRAAALRRAGRRRSGAALAGSDAAFHGIKAAVGAGELTEAQITRSVERILTTKARLGLHVNRTIDLATIDTKLASKEHLQTNAELSARALTLIKDERNQVPLNLPSSANVLYLSVLDYSSGWIEGMPSRTFVPELKKRWPNVTGVELSDRMTADQADLVRSLARRADAIVASVFVRIASFSGRMDLSDRQVALLEGLAALNKPYVAVMFGNPYTATFLTKLPTMLLAFEAFDGVELAAVRALAGEAPIRGKLPISLPGMFPFGHGLERSPRSASP